MRKPLIRRVMESLHLSKSYLPGHVKGEVDQIIHSRKVFPPSSLLASLIFHSQLMNTVQAMGKLPPSKIWARISYCGCFRSRSLLLGDRFGDWLHALRGHTPLLFETFTKPGRPPVEHAMLMAEFCPDIGNSDGSAITLFCTSRTNS